VSALLIGFALVPCAAAERPEGTIAQFGTDRFRHPDEVRFLAHTPDGTLAAASEDGVVRLYDGDGREMRRLDVERRKVTSLAISARGERLVLGCTLAQVRLVSLRKEARDVELTTDYLNGPNARLAASAAHDLFAFADGNGNVVVALLNCLGGWEVQRTFKVEAPVHDLAFDRRGEGMLVVRDAHSLRLFRGRSWHEAARIEQPPGPACVVFLSGDRSVAVACADGSLRLFDVETLQLRSWRRGHEGPIVALAGSPDGMLLASAGADGTVRLWEAAHGQPLRDCEHDGSVVQALSFHPNGKTLVGASGLVLRRWETATGRDLSASSVHRGGVTAVVYLDAATVASAGRDRSVRVWKADSGQEIRRFDTHGRPITVLAASPDGTFLAGGGIGGVVVLWNVVDGTERFVLQGGAAGVRALAFAPDGHRLLVGDEQGGLRVWDTTTGRTVVRTGVERRPVNGLAWSPDGRTLLARHGDGTLTRWNATDGAPLPPDPALARVLEGAMRGLTADGRYVLAGTSARLKLVRLDGGLVVAELPMPQGMRSMTLSPDARLLLVLTDDGAVTLIETASGAVRRRVPGTAHNPETTAFAMAPDGRTLAAGRGDGTVLVWPVFGQQPGRRLAVQGMTAIWQLLWSDDAVTVHEAIGELASDPERTLLWVRRAREVERVPVGRLVADLGAEDYPTREAATRDLALLGWGAAPELKRTFDTTSDLEIRRRALALLESLAPTAVPPRVRTLRLIETLERIGTPSALDALETFRRDADEVVRGAALDAQERQRSRMKR
jgi:WD40 repeat protein